MWQSPGGPTREQLWLFWGSGKGQEEFSLQVGVTVALSPPPASLKLLLGAERGFGSICSQFLFLCVVFDPAERVPAVPSIVRAPRGALLPHFGSCSKPAWTSPGEGEETEIWDRHSLGNCFEALRL